jgi:hypothetical protein
MTAYTKSTFLYKLAVIPRGQSIMYHAGYLYEDRTKQPRLHELAAAVYDEYRAGNCALVQRRHGNKRYDYYAVKL